MVDLIPKEFGLKYEVNSRKIKRYISLIRNVLSNFEYRHIEIVYQREFRIYRCYINN